METAINSTYANIAPGLKRLVATNIAEALRDIILVLVFCMASYLTGRKLPQTFKRFKAQINRAQRD